jgi:hypothetical protein
VTEQRLRTANLTFRPRARLLRLLGDQLIRDAYIAVFELVKNAYDADATRAVVTLIDIDNPQSGVILEAYSGIRQKCRPITAEMVVVNVSMGRR